jgi:hypothetical protein
MGEALYLAAEGAPGGPSRRGSRSTHHAASAFANCGHGAAYVQGSYVPTPVVSRCSKMLPRRPAQLTQ